MALQLKRMGFRATNSLFNPRCFSHQICLSKHPKRIRIIDIKEEEAATERGLGNIKRKSKRRAREGATLYFSFLAYFLHLS